MLFLNKNLIGIDVGTSCVKLVELNGGKNKLVKIAGLELLPLGCVVNGIVEEPEVLKEAIKRLAKRLKLTLRGRRCALSLGGSSIVVKRSVFEKIESEEDLAEQVRYQAEQHFQFDLDELFYDHYPMKEYAYEGGTPVIICGAKQVLVQSYVKVVRDLGMRVGVIDSDILCLANMFEYNYSDAVGLNTIVNIGASGTSVSLIYGNQYLYTREIPTGGDYYTQHISSELGIDREQAESLKVSAGTASGATPRELINALGELNEQLTGEISQCVDFYFQSGEAPVEVEDIERIFLVGGGARVLGLDATLAAKNNVNVEILNPFHKVQVKTSKSVADYILTQGHLYGVSVGLGLRSMND